MDLGTTFILLIIFGIIGFITEKIWGINPAKIYSDIVAIVVILVLVSFIPTGTTDLNQSLDNIENLVTFFADALPGIIIGDLAGTFVSKLTEVF